MDLQVKHNIVSQDWMHTDLMDKIFKALADILFVGGCVRNVILDKPIDDIDLATSLEPQIVMERLKEEGIKTIPTGLKHGTITVAQKGVRIEITTLRKDIKTDGRHAQVAYTDSWKEDAKRRDFTLNTLLMDQEGNIYDSLGCGLKDAKARIVKFVGSPEKRIKEDYLRILRFFRFSAYYAGHYNEEGLKACTQNASGISTLSKERITQEFFKIICSDNPHEVLSIMFTAGVLQDLPVQSFDLKLFEHVCHFQKRYNLQAISSRLYVLAGLDMKNFKHLLQYLLIPKVFIKDMKAMNGALTLPDLNCDSSVRESIYRFGRTITAQALMIELAQDRVMNAYGSQALNIVQNWDIPNFPVTGKDLIKRGFTPGSDLGKELSRLEEEWIKRDFSGV